MMSPLFQFDDAFRSYLEDWIALNEDKFEDVDQMEAQMSRVYEAFLDKPSANLQGRSPRQYFDALTGPDELLSMMLAYLAQGIEVPEPLLNRIAQEADTMEKPLMRIAMDQNKSEEARALALALLDDAGSTAVLPYCLSLQLDREDDDALADIAADRLSEEAAKMADAMLEALPLASDAGQETLLYILSHVTDDDQVLAGLLQLLDRPGKQAIAAACLGRLGREEALPALKAHALDTETDYLDYIELKSAIEQLGDECPARDFADDDAGYLAMSHMEQDSAPHFFGAGDAKGHFDGHDLDHPEHKDDQDA